jgi:hypothetical protein
LIRFASNSTIGKGLKKPTVIRHESVVQKERIIMGKGNFYVIGNGFDLFIHGLPTRYEDYRKFIASGWRSSSRGIILTPLSPFLEEYFRFNTTWSDFEKKLGSFDYKEFLEFNYPVDLDSERDNDVKDALDNRDDATSDLPNMAHDIINSLNDWICSIGITPSLKRDDLTFSPDDFFLTFNYTRILENCYGISPERIRHIHGVADKRCTRQDMDWMEYVTDDSSLILGTGIFKDIKSTEYITATAQLKEFQQLLTKQIQSLEALHIDPTRFDEIVIIGKGISGVDEPYFKQLQSLFDISVPCTYQGVSQADFNTLQNIMKGRKVTFQDTREIYDT